MRFTFRLGGYRTRTRIEQKVAKTMNADVDRKVRAAGGEIEAMFELQLLDAPLLIVPAFQLKPIANRKFMVDVAFVSGSVMANQPGTVFEVQGHVHRIKAQFLRDMERHNLLTELGWIMYYVSGDMVRDGRGLELVKRVVGTR